ncbi:MAG: DM13 domain-containing protein [Prochlorotrichaceae cyanobacterium]
MKRNFFLPLMGVTSILMMGCNSSPAPSSATNPTPESTIASSSLAESPTPESTETQAEQGFTILRSGSFVEGEYPTSGTVSIIEKDEQRLLELDEAFETSTSGPDLFVILHRSPDVIGSTTPPAHGIEEGDYVVLEALQAYSGAQSYVIPEDLNLDDFQSAAIWCRQFNATFGSARLQ